MPALRETPTTSYHTVTHFVWSVADCCFKAVAKVQIGSARPVAEFLADFYAEHAPFTKLNHAPFTLSGYEDYLWESRLGHLFAVVPNTDYERHT